MNFDSFLSSPRWQILEILAKNPSSPVEISQELGTSVSYISQQLKLLEAANLVVKSRTGSAEKGKPRMVYSIFSEIVHLSALMKGKSSKKVINLTDYHKLILRIWLLDNPDLHYHVEKFYWKVEDALEEVLGIFVSLSSKKPKVIVVSDSKKLKSRIDSYLKDFGEKLDLIMVSEFEFNKISKDGISLIYDPKFLLLGKELKGGEIR